MTVLWYLVIGSVFLLVGLQTRLHRQTPWTKGDTIAAFAFFLLWPFVAVVVTVMLLLAVIERSE